MKRIAAITVCLLVVLLLAGPGESRSVNAGLNAVAVSPDGATLVCGGDNRTLYVMDAATCTVKQRIYAKVRVGALCFTSNGSHLIVEDDTHSLHWYDAKTWKPGVQVQKAGYADFAPAAGLLAAVAPGYRKSTVKVLSMTDGSKKTEIPIESSVAGVCLNPAGTRLAVLTGYVKDPAEPKLSYKQIPKDLKGITRDVFVQKNDGKTSKIMLYDAATGKLLKERKLWYSLSGIDNTRLVMVGETVHVHHYSEVCVVIPWEGDIEGYRAKTRFHYGWGVAPDRKAFLCGSLRSASYVTLPERKEVEFRIDQLPGFPEYFRGFCVHSDGTAYAATSAFRVVKITKDGRVDKAVPVY